MSSVAVHDRYSIQAHDFSCSGLIGDLLHLVGRFLAREVRAEAEDEDQSILSPCHLAVVNFLDPIKQVCKIEMGKVGGFTLIMVKYAKVTLLGRVLYFTLLFTLSNVKDNFKHYITLIINLGPTLTPPAKKCDSPFLLPYFFNNKATLDFSIFSLTHIWQVQPPSTTNLIISSIFAVAFRTIPPTRCKWHSLKILTLDTLI